MLRARHECVVFPMPALPPGYVLPAPTPALSRPAFAPLPEKPLPQPWRSKRPCRAFPAVSAELVAAMNVVASA